MLVNGPRRRDVRQGGLWAGPYAILALFLSVLTASSSMGIAMSLAYYFAELILVRILGGLFDWFNSVTNFLLGANTPPG